MPKVTWETARAVRGWELATIIANEALVSSHRKNLKSFAGIPITQRFAATADQFYPEEEISRPAYRSSHPMIWGCLTADFPATARGILISEATLNPGRDISKDRITKLNDIMCSHYGLVDQSATSEDAKIRNKLKMCDSMPTSGAFQSVHFIRDWEGTDQLAAAYQTCKSAQDRIRQATVKALEAWDVSFNDPDANPKERFKKFLPLYFVGLALHTVQDAFSGAHTIRNQKNRRVIEKICHYNESIIRNKNYPDICQHGYPFDSRDIIWKGGEIGKFKPTRYITGAIATLMSRINGDMSSLTEEGQGATTASASYLLTFARIIESWPGDPQRLDFDGSAEQLRIVNDALDQFFNFSGDAGDDPVLAGSGYLNCENIVEKN